MAKGGRQPGAGRPRKADEEKLQNTIRAALAFHDMDEESFWAMVVEKAREGSSRHAQFVIQYLYGKAPETVKFQSEDEIIIKLGSQN